MKRLPAATKRDRHLLRKTVSHTQSSITLMFLVICVAATCLAGNLATAFVLLLPVKSLGKATMVTTTTFAEQLYATPPSKNTAGTTANTLELSLTKPLGLILEEVKPGEAAGVYVKTVMDTGSAVEYASQILGARLLAIQGQDVTRLDFEAAMETIINAPQTVTIQFLGVTAAAPGEEAPPASSLSYTLGETVSVTVQQAGKKDLVINAQVGDNLRKVLLDNGFEVYQGMKQKLGNCGGAGQCTFCAVDFLESKGWEQRSGYEDNKLAKFPGARLSCLNNIQGPVTLRKTPR